MTTALLLVLVIVAVPVWLAMAGAPGLLGGLRDRLLRMPGPDEVRAGVEENDELYRFARKSFEKATQTTRAAAQVDPAAAAEIAALNLFVEKAQLQLRQRALWCTIGAAACVLMDAAIAVVALVWLTGTVAATAGQGETAWPAVVLWGLRSAILAGLSFGLVYLFTSLARLLFNEASAAGEKRHAIGFGRLYVQMKVLAAPDPRRATRALSETEMLRAFGWNPPAKPPAAEDPPVRTLRLPPRPVAAVPTMAPARMAEKAGPPPAA